MADKTPDYALSGILVPRKFSATLAADYASGTDYTEAGRKPGAVTYDGASTARLVLEATGDVDATATSAPVLKFTRAGMPSTDGAGFVYRYGSSGDFYGADPTYALTGYTVVDSVASLETYGQTRSVVLADGTIVVVAVRTQLTNPLYTLHAHVRALDGTWTEYTIATSAAATAGSKEVALCLAPDGALHVYWWVSVDGATMRLYLYRSEDGATWYRQGEVNGISSATSITHLAAGTLGGSVVLFSGDTSSQQYVSADGGFSFETVGAAENHVHVADVLTSTGYLHVLAADTTGSEHVKARRIASGGQTVWDATANDLGANDKDNGSFLVDTPAGLLAYFVDSSGEMWSAPYRSVDAGASWSEYTGHADQTLAVIVGHPSAVWHRGRLHVLGYATTVSTGAPIADKALVDMTLAGHSVVPLYGAGIGDVERTSGNRRAWVPVELLNASGWTDNDTGTGTVTHTLLDEFERVSTDASSAADNSFATTVVLDPPRKHYEHCIVSLQVTSGTAEVVLEARPVSVSVFVTSTQIDVCETGTTPVLTPHNISGAIELRIICDAAQEKGRAWYREAGDDDERAWIDLGTPSLATTTYTQSALRLKAAASTTVEWRFVSWRGALLPALYSSVDMDTTEGTEIAPCAVLASRRTFVGSGIYLRGRGGPARYDATTYSVSLGGGRFTKANLLPALSASPRAPWRSTGTTAQTLKFTVEPETATETEWMGGLVGYYLDGLVNVPQFTIKNSGATIGAVDLRTSFAYTHDTGVIYPSASGSTVDGVYVAEGSLVGSQFEFADGKVRTIVDNTEGVLTSGSTVAEKRCRIRVDGLDGTEDTSGTGYIWPRRALILHYLRGTREVTQVQLEIGASVGADSRGYREIGVAAIGEVSVLGRAFDRTASDEIAAGVEVFEGIDGGSVVSVRGPTRRTVELAFVESPTFLGQPRSGGAPDYVTVSASGGALPAATEFGVPMTLEGIYRRTDGASLPVVPIRRIPRDSGSGSALYVSTIGRGSVAEGAMLARMTGSIRREQVQMGQAYVDDAERVATITFSEVV